MDHPNVLRYYTSWVQRSPAFNEEASDSEDESLSSEEDYVSEENTDSDDGILKFRSEDGDSVKESDSGYGDPEPQSEKQVSRKKWTLFIVTECCDRHLRKMLEKGPISDPDEALNVFAQIVEGLKYIQEQGVVHRDLKRDNIFLKNDQVKIADFSLAKFLKAETTTSDCSPGIGVEPYIAPEMKKGTVSMKSDIYSLGFLFYELLNDFETENERVIEIGRLKSEKTVSKFWVKERSGLTKLLMDMICDEEVRLDVVNLHSEIQQLQERRKAGELIWHASQGSEEEEEESAADISAVEDLTTE